MLAAACVCLVPASVRKVCVDDVRYLDLLEPATSPIIMSCRINDGSRELGRMARAVVSMHDVWGHPAPEAISRLIEAHG
jgi:hypothetical protein